MILVSRPGRMDLPPIEMENILQNGNTPAGRIRTWHPNQSDMFFQKVPSAVTSGTGYDYAGEGYLWNMSLLGLGPQKWYYADRLIPDITLSGWGNVSLSADYDGANGFVSWKNGTNNMDLRREWTSHWNRYAGVWDQQYSCNYAMKCVYDYNVDSFLNPYGASGGTMAALDHLHELSGTNWHGDGWYEFSEHTLAGPGEATVNSNCPIGTPKGALKVIDDYPSAVSAVADWGRNAYYTDKYSTTSPLSAACTFVSDLQEGVTKKAGIPYFIAPYGNNTYKLVCIPNVALVDDGAGGMTLEWKCLFNAYSGSYYYPNNYAKNRYFICYEYPEKNGKIYTIFQRGSQGWWEFKMPDRIVSTSRIEAKAYLPEGPSPEDDIVFTMYGYVPHDTCQVQYRIPDTQNDSNTEVWGMTIGAFSVCTMEY